MHCNLGRTKFFTLSLVLATVLHVRVGRNSLALLLLLLSSLSFCKENKQPLFVVVIMLLALLFLSALLRFPSVYCHEQKAVRHQTKQSAEIISAHCKHAGSDSNILFMQSLHWLSSKINRTHKIMKNESACLIMPQLDWSVKIVNGQITGDDVKENFITCFVGMIKMENPDVQR